MKLNWNFWRAGMAETKKPPMVEAWIFSGTTHSVRDICCHKHMPHILITILRPWVRN